MISDPLRTAIEALHQAIVHEPDAQDKQVLAQCLGLMLKVQAKEAAENQQAGARGALAGQLQGAQAPQPGQAY